MSNYGTVTRCIVCNAPTRAGYGDECLCFCPDDQPGAMRLTPRARAYYALALVCAGDRVTIRTPQGQERTGRAVMSGPHGWALNMGGRHGTPGVATPDNYVSHKKDK